MMLNFNLNAMNLLSIVIVFLLCLNGFILLEKFKPKYKNLFQFLIFFLLLFLCGQLEILTTIGN